MSNSPARQSTANTSTLALLFATLLLGAIPVAYYLMWDDLLRASRDWRSIALAIFSGLALAALPVLLLALRRRQWLLALSALASVGHAPLHLWGRDRLFSAERNFEYRAARWQAQGRIEPHGLATAVLQSDETLRLLDRDDAIELLAVGLNWPNAQRIFDLDDQRLPAVLARFAYHRRGITGVAALLRQPHGLDIVTGVLFEALRPLQDFQVEGAKWSQVRSALGAADGASDTKLPAAADVRLWTEALLRRVDTLSAVEAEVLLWVHSRVPVGLGQSALAALTARLASLKPHHAEYLRQLTAFQGSLCSAAAAGAPVMSADASVRTYLRPLLRICGHELLVGGDAAPWQAVARRQFTELYRHARSEAVYKTERQSTYSPTLRRSVTTSRQVLSHYESRGTDSRSRVDFALAVRKDGAEVVALAGTERLGDQWYDIATGKQTVEYSLVARGDSWLFTIPEDLAIDQPSEQ